MKVINIDHLTHKFSETSGIFDIDIQANEGESFGFLGPNGAGKTTTIRHLLGYIRPHSGTTQILGKDTWYQADEIQDYLGYVPGEIAFFDEMTGTEFLKFIQKYRGLKNVTLQKELIDRFELDTKTVIKKMSKGTKQKLGLVSAFMHDPQVLILDEPTSGLDPLMQNRFVDLVQQEQKKGKTLLISSHLFEEVERTCHQVAIIRAGHIVAKDNIENLRAQHIRTYQVTLPTEAEALAFAKDYHGEQIGNQVKVSKTASLESIFLHYYGGDDDE